MKYSTSISSTMDLLKVPQYGTEPRERKLVSDALPMTDNQPVKRWENCKREC